MYKKESLSRTYLTVTCSKPTCSELICCTVHQSVTTTESVLDGTTTTTTTTTTVRCNLTTTHCYWFGFGIHHPSILNLAELIATLNYWNQSKVSDDWTWSRGLTQYGLGWVEVWKEEKRRRGTRQGSTADTEENDIHKSAELTWYSYNTRMWHMRQTPRLKTTGSDVRRCTRWTERAFRVRGRQWCTRIEERWLDSHRTLPLLWRECGSKIWRRVELY